MFLAIHPLSSILCIIIGILIHSKTISQLIFKLSFIDVSIIISYTSIKKLVILPCSFKNTTIVHFKHTFSMFFVLFPLSHILSIWANKFSLALLHIIYPLTLIISIFKVEVFAETLLKTIHPLPLIN